MGQILTPASIALRTNYLTLLQVGHAGLRRQLSYHLDDVEWPAKDNGGVEHTTASLRLKIFMVPTVSQGTEKG